MLHNKPLRHSEVAQLVLVGMAADRPLESNFFPGLLEGLLGRLGIAAPGESKPPTSSREGAGRLCSSAMHKVILQIEWREVETPGSAGFLNAWISIMRRISLKSKVIRCQRSSRTHFSSLAWLMRCTRHSSLRCCLRHLPPLVAARFHPSQASQRTVDLNQRCLN